MHYFVYLDEFGHVGPYIAHDHKKHNDHPIFGLGGIVLPTESVREFNTFFFKLKQDHLSFEIEQARKLKGIPSYHWEKKGSSLYTVQNLIKYPQVRRMSFRIFNKLENLGGFVFYCGEAKKKNIAQHCPKLTYRYAIKESLKRLQSEFESLNSTFSLVFDEHTERADIYRQVARHMFAEGIYRLIEPPFEVDSKLYQSVQCADWVCGLIGRLSYFEEEPESKPEWALFKTYFYDRVKRIERRSSIRSFGKANPRKLQALADKFSGSFN